MKQRKPQKQTSSLLLQDIIRLYENQRQVSDSMLNQFGVVSRSLKRSGVKDDLMQWEPEHIDQWRADLLEERKVSVATWNNYLRHLKVLCNFAVDEPGINLDRSPLQRVRKLPEYQHTKKLIDLSEIQVLLAYLNSKKGRQSNKPAWMWVVAIRLLFNTAVRRQQLVGLVWRDINFQQGTIHLKVETSKTKRSWDIPLPAICRDDLLMLQERVSQQLGRPALPGDQVFNATLYNRRFKGDRLDEEQLSGFFRRLKDHTGVDVSPHRFRHAYGTAAAKVTKNIKLVKEQMGHTSIRTTYQYVHPDIEDLRELGGLLPQI